MIRENPPIGAPIWVDLMAADKPAAAAFLSSLLGWTADDPNEEFGGYQNLRLDGEMVAGLMARGEDPPMDLWTVYFHTADVAATVAAVESSGGMVFSGAMSVGDLGTMAVLADPAGAVFGLWQPGTHPGGVVGATGAPCHFELHTRDFDAVVPFYSEALGMTFDVTDLTDVSGDTGFRYALYDLGPGFGAGVVDASPWLPEGVPSHWKIYFASDDVDASIEAATAGGATLVQPAEDTPYGRLATLIAPGGSIFSFRGEADPHSL